MIGHVTQMILVSGLMNQVTQREADGCHTAFVPMRCDSVITRSPAIITAQPQAADDADDASLHGYDWRTTNPAMIEP